MSFTKYRKLAGLLEGHRRLTILLLVVMIVTAVFESVGVAIVFPLISFLVGLQGKDGFWQSSFERLLSVFPEQFVLEGLLATLIVAFLLKSVFMVLQSGMTTNLSMKLRERWTSRLYLGYFAASYERIMKERQGALVNNVMNEPLRAASGVTVALNTISRIIVAIPLLVMLVITDAAMLALVGFGGGLILYILWNLTRRYSFGFGKERLKLNQESMQFITEGFSAAKEIKVLNASSTFGRRLKDRLRRFTSIETKFSIFHKLPRNVSEFIVVSLLAVLLTYFHLIREANLREVLPLLGFFLVVSQRLLNHIGFILSQRMKIIAFLPSLELMYTLSRDLLGCKEQAGGVWFEELREDIALQDVFFNYSSDKVILRKANLWIPRCGLTVLTGVSGVGKSTVADLVGGLLCPQEGRLLVNGRDLRDYNLDSWRRKIGYVGQESVIFPASIRENILVGKPEATEAEMMRAAEMAHVQEFVTPLGRGYDTPVGDGGIRLSGGQKQRIAIARAIIRKPDLLIFDEATSALDRESEKFIEESIEALSKQKACLVITHRPTMMEKADVVYEFGTKGLVVKRDFLKRHP
jgi:subfamily B ATP-binding cassette protein MsbA